MVSVTNNLRYPGQWADDEVNLYYNWHRHYHPSWGRYWEADPIGLAGSINTYSYTFGNPLRFTDPWGLKTILCSETAKLLREAGQQNLLQAFFNHRGRGKYDLKYRQELDTFVVGTSLLTADRFGNYIAGYASYKAGGLFGYWGVRTGGIYYDFVDNLNDRARRLKTNSKFDWDEDSIDDINAGLQRAQLEEKGIAVDDCKCPK